MKRKSTRVLNTEQKNILLHNIEDLTQNGGWPKSELSLDVTEGLIGGLPPDTVCAICSGSTIGLMMPDTQHIHMFGVEVHREDPKDHPHITNADQYQGYYDLLSESLILVGPNKTIDEDKDFLPYHHNLAEAPLDIQNIVQETLWKRKTKQLWLALRKRVRQLKN